MKKISLLIIVSLFICLSSGVFADEIATIELSIEEILAKSDSAAQINDSIFAETKYSFEAFTVFQRLNKDGSVKSTDTTVSQITKRGNMELDREIIYSSSGDTESKKAKKHEKDVSLSFDDPHYNFSLIEITDDSYKIGIDPKNSPPKEGQYQGTLSIDKEKFYTKQFDFVVPNPEGALKEFSIALNFEFLEGGLVVPVDMKMRGFVKALLGIIKIRFAGEFKFSNYEILE